MAKPTEDPEIIDKEVPAPPKGVKKKKILLLLLGFILISTSGVGGIAFLAPEIIPGSIKNIPDLLKDSLPFMAKKDPEKPEKEGEKKTQGMAGHLYNLDPFMVNLVDTGKMRYLKIRMSLESLESKPNDEYEKRLPQLRDSILSVLAAKTQSDINDSQGKKKLREELTDKLNTVLTQFKLKTVFFTEFVIQ